MNKTLSHRGHDDSNIWFNESVGLGHQMMFTTLESTFEKLPTHNNNKNLIITSDARIDNRNELTLKLNLEKSKKIPDSSYILKSYEKWGERCTEHILGDFSFAIWDNNEKKLFCARDHMGVKPFFYYLSDKIFAFSTEIKSLFVLPEILGNINKNKISTYLQTNYSEDKTCTFYEDVSRLVPAHSLTVYSDKYELKNYWKLDPKLKITLKSDEEYYSKFLNIFSDAVRCRLRTQFNLGFDLSGGLDSTSIVCMAKTILEKENLNMADLNTFSYVFNEFVDIDERQYINKVVETGKIKPNFIVSDNIDPMGEMEKLFMIHDQPHNNPFLPIILHSFDSMAKQGIRVNLSGSGGDRVIYTGRNFLELATKFKWNMLVRDISSYSKVMGISPVKTFIDEVLIPLTPEIFKKMYRNFICKFKKIECSQKYLNKNLKLKIYKNQNYSDLDTLKGHHYFSIMMDSSQDFFETIDLAAASHQIEVRYPYYDKRLVEFCYAIPSDMKFRTWNRFIQRNAMNGLIPVEIQWRIDKANFKEFLTKNLIYFDKKKLENMINDSEVITDYIDITNLKNMYKKYIEGKSAYLDIYFMWLSLMLYEWLKKR